MNNAIYKHQAVNDLAWLFEAPMIVADLDLKPYWLKELPHKLSQLDESPEPLLDALKRCKSHFLGAYFEVLFSFGIRHFSTLEIVLEHQQLINPDGSTLGEVDMLVTSPEGTVFQFEIALKYFLEVNKGVDTDWIGPNKTDSLSKKTHKARTKQLTVLDSAPGKALLKKNEIEETVEPVLLIFGYLFYCGRPINKAVRPQLEESEHVKWMYFNQFDVDEWGEYCFCELIKPKWITHKKMQSGEIVSYQEVHQSLTHTFVRDTRPKMYLAWKKCVNEVDLRFNNLMQDHTMQQPVRIFIVPNEW
ncbi:DUF1853 family protein [Marinomonas algicola]|uniref:DUF1853 family protein n=1 Tax=Marinomonas algicola TaxID=2773454 RepID=UPI0017497235|nr:DUF1853 family protein [Marinomonas algicola]